MQLVCDHWGAHKHSGQLSSLCITTVRWKFELIPRPDSNYDNSRFIHTFVCKLSVLLALCLSHWGKKKTNCTQASPMEFQMTLWPPEAIFYQPMRSYACRATLFIRNQQITTWGARCVGDFWHCCDLLVSHSSPSATFSSRPRGSFVVWMSAKTQMHFS